VRCSKAKKPSKDGFFVGRFNFDRMSQKA